MKKIAYLLTVVLVLCLGGAVFAQMDSSRLDLGYTYLNKKFTQNITIRGADLEKMPFTTLSDAIAPWLYGAYSTSGAILYIVDGNPLSDPNAYSIYDIEEIVLVQDATALIGTNSGQQQLVLITTRRGKGKKGITAAVQTGLVNASANGKTTDTRLYHQYYVGGYRNLDKISFGVSGGFQRDVMPIEKQDDLKINTPYNLQRWRLNGYFDWRVNKRNLVEVAMNYTPEKLALDGKGTDNVFEKTLSGAQHYLQPSLRWHSELLPGLKNDLQGNYFSSVYKENDDLVSELTYPVSGEENNQGQTKYDNYFWRVRDRLSYGVVAGDWRIESALDYSYEHLKVSLEQQNVLTRSYNAPNYPPNVSTDYLRSYSTQKSSVLTPAVDVSFRQALNIQAGLVMNISNPLNGLKHNLPYVRAALDLLRMGSTDGKGDAGANNSLKIFGSYAQRTILSPYASLLVPLSVATTIYDVVLPWGASQTGVAGGFTPSRTYWSWESGVSYSVAKNRLQLQYVLERRNMNLPNQPWRSTMHHFNIRAKVVEGDGVSWETGLNVTLLRSKPELSAYSTIKPGLGDAYPDKYSPTGGWVNRVRVKRFIAGVDLLYHFAETVNTPTGDNSHVSSVVMPNVYAGYSYRSTTLFAECRGLVKNHTQDMMDQRKYYTLGATLNL